MTPRGGQELLPKHTKNKGFSRYYIGITIFCLTLALLFFSTPLSLATSQHNPNWLKENTHPIQKIRPEIGDQYQDLAFLGDLLKNKQLIFLGESSHGTAEFSSVKVRLIEYLHKKLGYRVLVFESGLGELFAENQQIQQQTSTQALKNSLFDIWQTKEVLSVFDYAKKSKNTRNPLHIAGMDMQAVGGYGSFLKKWFQTVNPQMGKLAEQTEEDFSYTLSQSEPQAYKKDQSQLLRAYQQLYQFTKQHRQQLLQTYPASTKMLQVTQYVLQDRIHSVTSVIPYYVSYNHYQQIGNDLEAKKAYDQYNIARDQVMAKHLTWITETLYPNEKIIVWAHNLHIRKANSKTSNPQRSAVLNLGELLPSKIKQKSYVLGLYMNRGVSALNDHKPLTVQYPHPSGTVESILEKTGYSNVFVDLSQASKGTNTTWMFRRGSILDWGAWSEQLIPKEQYDGILFLDKVKMPQYIKANEHNVILFPYFSKIDIRN
jgi:erythromycin esterase